MHLLKKVILFIPPIICGIFFMLTIKVFGSFFENRIINPLWLFAFIFTLAFAIIEVIGVYKKYSILHLKMMIFYLVVIIFPLILMVISHSLTPNEKMRYLEGETLEYCSTGKPLVPWGRPLGPNNDWGNNWKRESSPDACFKYFGDCKSIHDFSMKVECFEFKHPVNSTEDCDFIGREMGDEYSVKNCRFNLEVEKQRLDGAISH